jgi:predicted NBD/HSP70 family sugar kinase
MFLNCLADLSTHGIRSKSEHSEKGKLVSIDIDQTDLVLVVLDADGRIASDHKIDREARDASEKLPGSRIEMVTRKWLEAHRSNPDA